MQNPSPQRPTERGLLALSLPKGDYIAGMTDTYVFKVHGGFAESRSTV